MILVDTHVILWMRQNSREVSVPARRAITAARRMLVSPLSLFEIGRLVVRERVRLDRPLDEWTRDLVQEDDIAIAPVTPTATVVAAELSSWFPADPIDRMLYATALELRVPFVTKDRGIRAHAAAARDLKVIW